ncbi:hypothetical protein O8W32_07955 [Methanomassiliicoccales archaeon LGM-DZ1]|nr:hypothetical protein O8W32_07955 [Methanomassiliicoccales archaeon LGM-DZ1]
MKSRFLVLVLAAVLAVPAFSVMAADGSSADTSDGTESSGFEITYTLKGTEYTVSYDGPDDKAVIFGYAVGKTVDQAGMYSKIYAAGPYANNALAEDGNEKVQRLPSLYNSGNIDQIYTTLVQAAEKGYLDKENTTVILTTYIDNSLNLRNKLTEAGFTHILFYGSIESYDQVVSCVSDIEKALGSSEGLADSMTQTEEEVTAALSGAEKKDFIYLWYSSSNGWGAKQSGLAVTLGETAAGNNAGYTSDSTSGTYYNENFIIQCLSSYPDCVIVLDSGYVRNYEGSAEKFVEEFMGGSIGSHTIFVCEQEWNNYDPQFADGLKAFATALHPDIYSESDVKVYSSSDFEDGSSGSGIGAAVYAGAAAAAIVLVGAVLWLRSRH